MIKVADSTIWGLLWRSKNRRDGVTEHLLYVDGVPLIFATKKEAQAYAQRQYGYIKTRPDLRREPHGWRMPKPVRVRISRSVDGVGVSSYPHISL